MKKTRILCLCMVVVMLLAFTACGETPPAQGDQKTDKPVVSDPDDDAKEDITITFLCTKGEIIAELEELAAIYSNATAGVTVEIIPAPVGKSPFEIMTTMLNSGNAPTLAMVDPGDVPVFKEIFAVLDDEAWIADTSEAMLGAATVDGNVYAFPFTVEGFGFIYNKAVLDEAFGGSFDPSTITSRAALKDAFDKVVASGKDALIVSPMDWSLGAHLFIYNYLHAAELDQANTDEMFASLKAGTFDLANNASFNSWVDTFDVLIEYNSAKSDPLAVTYEKGPEVLGKAEVGFWFMGNWAWPQINEFDTVNGEYGFIPYPMSDTSDEFNQNAVVVFATKQVGIETTQNTPEQQAAAKDFLNWLVYDSVGQDAYVNGLNVLSAFSNITLPAPDPLAQSLADGMAAGKTIDAATTFQAFPGDHWSVVGAALQKYLSGYSNRAELAADIAAYWQSVS